MENREKHSDMEKKVAGVAFGESRASSDTELVKNGAEIVFNQDLVRETISITPEQYDQAQKEMVENLSNLEKEHNLLIDKLEMLNGEERSATESQAADLRSRMEKVMGDIKISRQKKALLVADSFVEGVKNGDNDQINVAFSWFEKIYGLGTKYPHPFHSINVIKQVMLAWAKGKIKIEEYSDMHDWIEDCRIKGEMQHRDVLGDFLRWDQGPFCLAIESVSGKRACTCSLETQDMPKTPDQGFFGIAELLKE